MIEVKEIKLSLRYPNSKQEDITDAFMRGYTNAVDATKKAIERLEKDNDKLRELCKQMYPRAKAFLQMGVQLGCNDTLSYDWEQQMRDLGVEVPE